MLLPLLTCPALAATDLECRLANPGPLKGLSNTFTLAQDGKWIALTSGRPVSLPCAELGDVAVCRGEDMEIEVNREHKTLTLTRSGRAALLYHCEAP